MEKTILQQTNKNQKQKESGMNAFEVYLIENLDSIITMLGITSALVAITGIAVFAAAIVKMTEGEASEETVKIAVKGIAWGMGIALVLFAITMLLPTSKKMARIVIVPKVTSELYLTEDKAVDDFVQNYLTKEAYKEEYERRR